MKSNEVQAVNQLKKFFQGSKHLPKQVMDNMDIVFNTVTHLDQEVKQKEQLLVQKDKNLGTLKETGTVGEQKEFVEALHKLYPNNYPERLEDWSSDTWGKQVIDRGDHQVIKDTLPTYRKQVLEKEFMEILHELYPTNYPVNFKDWPADSWGKEVIDKKDYKVIEDNLPIYKQWLANKKELIEILPKLHPNSYPVKYEEWTNQYAKGLLDNGDYQTIEQSLPVYRKQLAKKEFIEIIPKLYPNYPVGFENWTNQWGKGVVDREDYKTIQDSLPVYKKQLLKKEFIDIMHQVNPKDYPAKFEDWSNKSLGKEIVEKEDYKAMEQSLSNNRQKLKEREKEELLSQKENELKKLAGKDQLLNDREQEIAKFKELLSIKEAEAQNKDQLLLAKELEKQELARQKEIEKQELLAQQELEKKELLAQKEAELHEKSFVKNQVIGELHGALSVQEKEALNLKIELLTKQLAFKEKEVELHKKEAEDARIISELKGQLLTLKALYGHDVSFAEEFSAIQFRAENSIANNDFDDIADLSRYISRLVEAERDNSVSVDFSNLLANISPINHGEQQPIYRSIYIEDRSVQPGESLAERQMESLNLSSMMHQDRQNQVLQTGESLITGEQMSVPLNQGNIMNHGVQNQNLIGNFDNQHITHSVVLGGEGSESFSIIDAENSH